jgi:LPS-assembly lipoprotein
MSARLLAGALALIVLSACGLRLAGTETLPPPLSAPYLETRDDQTDFAIALRRRLEASGARLSAGEKTATAVVRILRDTVSERVLSVSAQNLPREFELTHTVEFEVTAGERQLLSPQEVELTRDFTFDERALLAKEREQAILGEALASDLAGIVLRRLAAIDP